MGFRQLSEMFPSAIQKANIERQIDAVRVCALWSTVVHERFSSTISVYSDALSYDEHTKVLVVGVANASISCELQYAAHVIKKEIHLRLGRADVIERIIFKVVGMEFTQ